MSVLISFKMAVRVFNVPDSEDYEEDIFDHIPYGSLNTNVDFDTSDDLKKIYNKTRKTSTNYWTRQILNYVSRKKSKVMKFATCLHGLLNWPMSQIITEFPKDYLYSLESGNNTIKQVLESLLMGLTNPKDSKEWFTKQIIIRSILTAVKEYRMGLLNEKNDTQQSGTVNTKIGQKLNENFEDEESMDMHIESRMLGVVRSLSQYDNSAQSTTNVKSDIWEYYRKLILENIESLRKIVIEDELDVNNGVIPYKEEIVPIFEKFMIWIGKMKEQVQTISKYDSIMDFLNNTLELIGRFIQEKIQDNIQFAEAPIPDSLPVPIFLKCLDMFDYVLTSAFGKHMQLTLANNRPEYNSQATLLDEITTNLKKNYSEAVFERVFSIYLQAKSSKDFLLTNKRIPKKDEEYVSRTDVAELLNYLNKLGNNLDDNPEIRKAWSPSDETYSIMFFTDTAYSYMLMALSAIHDIDPSKAQLTIMDLVCADLKIMGNYAKAVKLQYTTANTNVRQYSDKDRFRWDETRFQKMSDITNTKACKKFFTHVHKLTVPKSKIKKYGVKSIVVYDERSYDVVKRDFNANPHKFLQVKLKKPKKKARHNV